MSSVSLSENHAKPTSEELDHMDRSKKKVKVSDNGDSEVIMDEEICEVDLEEPKNLGDAMVSEGSRSVMAVNGGDAEIKESGTEGIPVSVEAVKRIPDSSELRDNSVVNGETNDNAIYGPWMVVQKHPRRKQIMDKGK
ncbi:hypothetical protein RIF29_21356 [Crotalaria pallida]|uniref:Uncharacterized protein n=1 Tax=Crotalaria pallida TaxID=3830 RepID=A0AAN9F6H3_CROPI